MSAHSIDFPEKESGKMEAREMDGEMEYKKALTKFVQYRVRNGAVKWCVQSNHPNQKSSKLN